MGIFRRSPSPAVPAHTAAEASPSLDGASSSNDSKTSLDHAYHHHLHVDRAYHSTSSPAMPSSSSSPTLQPHAVDHHQQSQSRSRSRSPLFNDTSSTSTQQQIHTQRARSPALLTPSHYDGQASSSSSPIGHAYSTGTTTPIPSPQPGNTNNSNFGNATSPWASYLPEGQFTGASSSESSSSSKSRSKNKKDLKLKPNSSSNSSNNSATQSSNNDDSSSTRAMAESRSVECKRLQLLNNDDESSRKSKALDLARFSVNGMLNLVEQRMMMEEQEQSKQQTRHEYGAPTSRFANRAHGLGLSVSVGRSAPGFSATQRMGKYSPPSSRHMHTVGEEAESEEILSSSPSRAKAQTMQQAEGRHRTSSAASSDTTQLRDEVVDLLQLARKASSSSGSGSCITASTSSASAGSAAPSSSSARGLDSDSQSYTSRSSESSNALRQMVDTQHVTAKYAPGTASREELENLARAISPFPIPSTTSSTTTTKPKKKFGGLFGGGSSKKNDSSKEESKIRRSPSPLPMPSTMEATAISRSQSPLPTMEVSPAAMVLPQSSTQIPAGARRALHPPVAGAQRALVSAQHRRKRSMSVGDAVPFAILQSARQATSSSSTQHNARNGTTRVQQQQQSHRLARPDVYDESYFSSSKMPYYHHLQTTSLNEKKRSNQLGRLGISEDDLEVDVQVRHDEEESLQGAKERLLAQSRNVVGHPIASSSNSNKTETWQRKDGPQVRKVDEAQYATYHQDTKSGEVQSASASLSSMASSNASSSSSSSATSRETATKRRGQLVVQDDTTGQYKLRNDSSSSSQGQPQVNVTSWTTPSQPAPSKTENKTRINRSNSDASFIDPFLPHASSNSSRADAHPTSASNVRRPAQLAVPAHTTNMKHLAHTHTQDSVKAIGPPPASPLPSPPRTSSSLPSSRVPSPSHQVGLAPAPSPAPTSPLPPLPAAICSPPTKYNGLPLPPTRPPPAAPSSLPSSSTAKLIEKGDKDTKYDFELRPHRTKQQGRAKMSPLTERDRSPPLLETPALDRHTLGTPRLFGTKGIVQRPPSALDMTLLPSPSPSPSAAVIPAPICTTVQQPSSSASSSLSSSAASLSGSISSGSMITPKAREFNRDQIRRREETSTTVASQYSTEGDFESYDSSSSIASASASSAAMVERVHSNGSASSSSSSSSISGNCSSAAGHTTLSNTTSYSSSSMSSYVTRPSLSMDGHSTSSCSDDYSSVSTHDQQDLDSYRCLRVISPYDHPHHEHLQQQKHQKQAYTYTHVNDAVPLKPPRNMSKMTPSPSCESVNNLAGIGLAGASSNVVFPHSRRMHFGWSRHKAMRDLSSHAEVEGFDNDGEDYDIEHVRIGNGMTSPASPGSEDDDAYAGILSDYAKTLKLAKDDEGYMGSSPEMTSPTTSTTANVLSRSHGNSSARQKITHDRPTVKQARSFDQLKAYR